MLNFRRGYPEPEDTAVEKVSSIQLVGRYISEDLSWLDTTTLALLYLKRARVPASCRGSIQSILTSCIPLWCGGRTASCRKTLQHIVEVAGRIICVVNM